MPCQDESCGEAFLCAESLLAPMALCRRYGPRKVVACVGQGAPRVGSFGGGSKCLVCTRSQANARIYGVSR
jgi:hypothetical protein